MAETLQNIPIPSETWIDIYTLTTITDGNPVRVQNIGTTELYYSISATEPPRDSEFYKIFSRGEEKIFDKGDLSVWIFSPQADGLINIEKYFGSITDFSIRVGLGLVSGISSAAVVMKTPKSALITNDAFNDVWGGGTIAASPLNMTWPIVAETWTIESTSTDDVDQTGTGAWSVLIQSLDIGYEIQTPETVLLNGANKVVIDGTHYRAHQLAASSGAIVIQANPDPSGTQTNIGDLIIRDQASNAIRMVIKSGVGKCEDGHIAVPAGITLFGLALIPNWDKDESGQITNNVRASTPNAPFIQTGVLSGYQNDLTVIFQAKFRSSEKTDRIFTAKPANNGAETRIIEEFYVVDNAIAGI